MPDPTGIKLASRPYGKRSTPPAGGHGRELAEAPATRYNRGMVESTLLLVPELRATVPARAQHLDASRILPRQGSAGSSPTS